MDAVLTKLAIEIPWGVAIVIVVLLFLRYLQVDRKEWREFLAQQNATWTKFLETNNCSHAESMARFANELAKLTAETRSHDQFVREKLGPATRPRKATGD